MGTKVPIEIQSQVFLLGGAAFAVLNGLTFQVANKADLFRKIKGLDTWRNERLNRKAELINSQLFYIWIACFVCSFVTAAVGAILKTYANGLHNSKWFYLGYPCLILSVVYSFIVGYSYFKLTSYFTQIERKIQENEERSRLLSKLNSPSEKMTVK